MITMGYKISRGHLNPAGLNSFDDKFWRATFTLTNAAPMFEDMNKGAWEKYEKRIRQYAKCPCGSVRKGTLYLLTGTSNYGIKKKIGTEKIVKDTEVYSTYQTKPIYTKPGWINLQIPRAIWTAGCCVWEEREEDFGINRYVIKAESFAVMCNNENGPDVLLAEMSVPEVELLLTDPRYGKVKLFPKLFRCGSPVNPDFRLPP